MQQFHKKQVHDSLQLHSSLLTDSKCAAWQTSPFSWETNRINPVWHSFLFQQLRLSTWSGKYCCISHDLVFLFFLHKMICKQPDGIFPPRQFPLLLKYWDLVDNVCLTWSDSVWKPQISSIRMFSKKAHRCCRWL